MSLKHAEDVVLERIEFAGSDRGFAGAKSLLGQPMIDSARIEVEFPGDLGWGEPLFPKGFEGSSMIVLSISFTDCIPPLPEGLAAVPVEDLLSVLYEGFSAGLYAEEVPGGSATGTGPKLPFRASTW
jgi:hypothetical protein